MPDIERKVVEFIELLRRNQIRVAMSEGLDAFRALDVTGIADKAAFRAALRATLIKNNQDEEAFDSLFELYFSGMADTIRRALAESQARAGEAPNSAFNDELMNKLEELDFDVSELVQALLQNDSGKLEQLMRQAAEQAGTGNIGSPFQEGFYTYKMVEQLDWYQAKYDMQQLAAKLRGAGERELADRLDKVADDRMRTFQELIKEYVKREFDKANHDFRRRFREKNLMDKNFFTVDAEELRRMEDVVRQLAEKLKTRVSMRRKRAKRHGTLNLQATLRKNIAYGGVPFHIEYRRKKKEKPQLIVLCDVSDSVRQASAFMLRFVYSVQELFSRVRSFVFVSDIGEVTELFKECKEPGEALQRAFNGEVINVWQNSNFGRAFVEFHKGYLDSVNKRTTVIILGDGRNNYNNPHDWVLRDIQQKAKKLIWLNPEGRRSWGVGDSEMPKYVRYCDMAEEVRTLNQLRRVIDGIVV
jgi:uncharacterized protein with von Willebrand factor type A (vWA) domain